MHQHRRGDRCDRRAPGSRSSRIAAERQGDVADLQDAVGDRSAARRPSARAGPSRPRGLAATTPPAMTSSGTRRIGPSASAAATRAPKPLRGIGEHGRRTDHPIGAATGRAVTTASATGWAWPAGPGSNRHVSRTKPKYGWCTRQRMGQGSVAIRRKSVRPGEQHVQTQAPPVCQPPRRPRHRRAVRVATARRRTVPARGGRYRR